MVSDLPAADSTRPVLVDKPPCTSSMPLVPGRASLYSQFSQSKRQCRFAALDVLRYAYLSEHVDSISSIQWLSIRDDGRAGQSVSSLIQTSEVEE